MKKASAAEKRILMMAGVIVITLIAIVFVVNGVIGLQSSMEGQAKVMANMVAISVNSLSTMDAGYVQKKFDVKEPFIVTIYDKNPPNGEMYVKVMYDSENKKFTEVPLLVKVEPVAPTSLDSVYVMKDAGGSIRIEGKLEEGLFTDSGDVGCVPPQSDKELQDAITSSFQSASAEYPDISGMKGWDEGLVKALIMKESSFKHCRGTYYTKSWAGAIGLMQLMPKTAAYLNVNRKDWKENVEGGTRYLAEQINRFKNIELGVAAYNCGPGCISTAKKNCEIDHGSCNNWETVKNYLTADVARYYQETLAYVPKVMEYYGDCYASNAVVCSIDCKSLC